MIFHRYCRRGMPADLGATNPAFSLKQACQPWSARTHVRGSPVKFIVRRAAIADLCATNSKVIYHLLSERIQLECMFTTIIMTVSIAGSRCFA